MFPDTRHLFLVQGFDGSSKVIFGHVRNLLTNSICLLFKFKSQAETLSGLIKIDLSKKF